MILSTRIRSNHRLNKIVLFLPPPLCLSARPANIMSERERAADGDFKSRWGKSPHPPGTQPYASTGGESHGNGTETTRPVFRDDAVEPATARSRVSLRVTRWAFT